MKQLTQEQTNLIISSNNEELIINLIYQGYCLEKFLLSDNYKFRQAVAHNHFGLETLINDKSDAVRIAVAKQGYGLDILVKDSNRAVFEVASRMLYEQNISDTKNIFYEIQNISYDNILTGIKLCTKDREIEYLYVCGINESCAKNNYEIIGNPKLFHGKKITHVVNNSFANIVEIILMFDCTDSYFKDNKVILRFNSPVDRQITIR